MTAEAASRDTYERLNPPFQGKQWDCQGTTKAGKPCRSTYVYLTDSGPWCYIHDPTPETVAKRKKDRERGLRAMKAGREKAKWRREAEKQGAAGPFEWGADGHLQVRWSKEQRRYVAEGFHSKLESGEMTQYDIAAEFGVDQSTVSRWYGAVKEDLRRVEMRDDWELSDYAKLLLTDFAEFRKLFTPSEPTLDAYVMADHHWRWLDAIERTVQNGGKLQILSPPRHGKSEFLMHYVVWCIIRNPNINIMWVALNAGVAADIVSNVKDILEDPELHRWFLPPGETFQGKPWAADKFNVALRRRGIKGNTLIALGRGSGTLSKDVDLLILDDIEDADSTNTETGRAATRRWMNTQIISRKMSHTAVVKIGSRQHPDDLDHHLIESPGWLSIVEEMHDPTCDIPHSELERHVDCLLWPQVRTFELWLELREAYASDPDLGLAYFDMVYQNNPAATQILTFTKELVDQAMDPTRQLGVPHVNPERYDSLALIGGIDPAATGYMATFIWAYAPNSLADDPRIWEQWLVDLDNSQGGGIEGIRRAVRWGFETYGVMEWVIEDNSFQKVILDDRDLLDYCARRGILLHGHQTLYNKTDDNFGVTSMVKLFQIQTTPTPGDTGTVIHLPTGSKEADAKTRSYRSQLIRWDGKRSGKGATADIVMASWFPLSFIRARAAQAVAPPPDPLEDGYAWDQDDYDPLFGDDGSWLAAAF